MSVSFADGAISQGPAAVEPDNMGHVEPSTLPLTYVVIAIVIDVVVTTV